MVELLLHHTEEPLDLVRLADVDLGGDDPPAGRLDRVGRARRDSATSRSQIATCGAEVRKRECDGFADPDRRARHHRDAIRQQHAADGSSGTAGEATAPLG